MISLWYMLGLLMLRQCVFAHEECTEKREHNRMCEIIQKLNGLGELQPSKCLREAESMEVVQPKPPSKINRPLVMNTIFKSASEIFQKNTTSARWNARELLHLNDLLGQQSRCFQNASSGDAPAGEEVQTWRTFWTSLDQFLEKKKFSACAWESIRHAVLPVMRKVRLCTTSRRHPRSTNINYKRYLRVSV